MTEKIYQSTAEFSGWRLDKYLASIDPSISRQKWQEKITAGLVTINNLPVKSSFKLAPGTIIKVIETEIGPSKDLSQNLTLKPKIIDRQTDYLVINKPAGLAVHGGKSLTLIDWLIKEMPSIVKVGEDLSRPGIVHRLDKDVSGLMVIALNNNFFENIKNQFKKRQVTKKYLALVYGVIKKDQGEIDFLIDRSSKGYRMAAKPKNQTGRSTITIYKTLERFPNFTLVEVTIKTGRTHQIRAHFSAIGHPIVGDHLYGNRGQISLKNKRLNLNRLFLVAVTLGFYDINGFERIYKIPLPIELSNFLDSLRQKYGH